MFGDKLKKILKDKKLTQKKIANIIDISQQQISNFLNNKSFPSQKVLQKLAHALNVPVSYFLEDIDISNPNIITDLVKIPVIGEIPAGQPIEKAEDYVDAMYVPEQIIKNKKVFGLVVKGDSMYPQISPGDYIVIATEMCCDNGDIVACRFIDDNEVTLKKYVSHNGSIILQPENNKYPPIIVNEKIEIIGKAIFLQRKI